MKGALTYLTFTKLKNQLKQFITKPAYIIYGIFMIGLMVLMAFSGSNVRAEQGSLRDISELSAILLAFFTMMFVMMFLNGISQGASMFTLADVNLVFPSPQSPRLVLFYGLVRQLGTSILLGFFILFQYSWLHGQYGVGYPALILIILGYGLTIFLAQLSAMTFFCYFSGNDGAKRIIRLLIYVLALLLVIPAVLYALPGLQSKDYMAALQGAVTFFNLPSAKAFPVSGWISGIITAIFRGDLLQGGILALALAVYVFILLLLLVKNKSNYYEDVIKTAEVAQSAITAKKEGNVGEAVGKNVKLGKVGLGKGNGANAIYYKHLKENQRSGILGISNMSLLFCAIILFTSFFMREAGIIAVFSFSVYMQLFSVSMGRFSRELIKPYIYLIPQPPLKKLYYSVLESLRAGVMEAIVLFVAVGFLIGASPIETAACIIARISVEFLLTATNIVLMRIFGGVRSKAFVMILYFLIAIILLLPAIAAAIFISILLPGTIPAAAAALLGFGILNIPVSLLAMYLCRNMLQYAEYNNQ